MMSYCAVPFCKSVKRLNDSGERISFHEFPVDLDLREKWILSISRKDPISGNLWMPSCRSVICSKHFTADCFKPNRKRKLLIAGSVPSIFPDYSSYMGDTRLSKRPYVKKQKSILKNQPVNVISKFNLPADNLENFTKHQKLTIYPTSDNASVPNENLENFDKQQEFIIGIISDNPSLLLDDAANDISTEDNSNKDNNSQNKNSKDVENEVIALHSQIKILNSKLETAKRKICRLKVQIRTLRRENLLLKSQNNE